MSRITKEIIDRYIENSITDNLVAGAPASLSQLKNLEMEMGISFPKNVIEFYQIYNGIGIKSSDGRIYWHFHPLEEMVQFTDDVRSSFMASHQNEAICFFPVYDWNSGGAIGYVLKPDGRWKNGLFEFDYESYSFDKSQPISEFFRLCNSSLFEFLSE